MDKAATKVPYNGIPAGSRGSSSATTPTPTRPSSPTPAPTKAPVCNGRTRKAWKDLTPAEKETYNSALALSMDNGAYQHFWQMHQYLFRTEIHNSCAFLLWHRKFLLGFENMLRSLGPQYACVTIPYYDYVQDSVAFRANRCNSIASCSPIARELASGPAFAGKFRRADWSRVPLAAEMSHLLIQTYLLPANNAGGLSQVNSNVESNVHNMVHNQLSMDMAMALSPRDPIFFSHHATIDLLHTIYYQCRASGQPLSDPRVFPASCSARLRDASGNGGFTITAATDVFLQESASVNALTAPVSAPWYAGLPNKYSEYVNANALGSFSYNYQLSGPLGSMLNTCGPVSRRLSYDLPMNKTNVRQQVVVGKVSPINDNEYRWEQKMKALCVQHGLSALDTQLEMERQQIQLYQNCFQGDVEDYTAAFKEMMGIPKNKKAHAKAVLDAMQDGSAPLLLPKTAWTKINLDTYGCAGDIKIA